MTVAEVYPRSYARYVLLERLGAGGMSDVDLARQAVDDGSFVRFSVIKRIKPDYATDDSFIRMFKDEARITSELHHANIGAVYDFGKVGDEYYLALEYVPGIDLRFLVNTLRERGQRVPVRVALKVVAEVLTGLGYAHAKKDTFGRPMGIVHRDVNPRNVMLSIRGEVKLIDFGVAKAADRLERTRTDHVKGKFSYMAPEQLTGSPIDHRSDLYAAALVLHELLAGVSPFFGLNQVQVLHRMVKGDIPELPPLPELQDDKELRRVLAKALAQDAADRYPTAEAFADALRMVAVPIGGLPTSDQLAAFLGAVDAELTTRLQRKMEEYARMETPSDAGAETVEVAHPRWPREGVRDDTGDVGPMSGMSGMSGPVSGPSYSGSGSGSGARERMAAQLRPPASYPVTGSGSGSGPSLSRSSVSGSGSGSGSAPRPVPRSSTGAVPRRELDLHGTMDPKATPAVREGPTNGVLAGGLVAVSVVSAIVAAAVVALILLGGYLVFGKRGDQAVVEPLRPPPVQLPVVEPTPVLAPAIAQPEPGPHTAHAQPRPHPRPEPVVQPTGVPDLGEPGIVPPEPEIRPGMPRAPDPDPEPEPEPEPEQALVEPTPVPVAPAPAIAPDPAPAPDPADDAYGFVNVSAVDRGLPVTVDGENVGVTPLLRYRVGLGAHDVRVTGYSCVPSAITVRRNQVSNVTCK